MNTVAIIDYGMCNLDSMARAVEECGGNPLVTSDPRELERAARLILPGVGAFPDAMRNLKSMGLAPVIREQAHRQIPVLGVCLGMQLLATRGFEIEETEGLDLVPGEVRRLVPTEAGERIPHVGWNEIDPVPGEPLFEKVAPHSDVYFVHSFHLIPSDAGDVIATTPYCGGFASAVRREYVWATQFHPEKSQRVGFAILRNFLTLC